MLQAHYYDGKSARRFEVALQFTADHVLVSGEGIARQEVLAATRISERLGMAPRSLSFADGAFCEVRDVQQLESLLSLTSHRDGYVDRWQRSWPIAVASVLLMLAIGVASYRWGLPWVAGYIAERVPNAVIDKVSSSAREALEGKILKPSTLTGQRQRQLQEGLDALKGPDGVALPPHHIYFHSSPQLGANAISLPDGSILLLDDLVKLADNDEQIYGVLGHELGHVHYRHGLRLLLEGSAIGGVTAWWFGDFSSLLVIGPSLVLQSRYSREFETQADQYSERLMRANHIKPRRLAEMLQKLADAHAEKLGELGKKIGPLKHSVVQDYLSSHPATEERIGLLNKD